MADNNGTRLNFLKIHIKEECSPTNIKVEDVEEIIKTETEISEGSQVYQYVDINKLLANENRNLENSQEQLLNENSGIKEEVFEGNSEICEINNLSTSRQKVNENGMHIDNEHVDCGGEEKISQQDLTEDVKIYNKEENIKFLDEGNDCLSIDTMKKKVLVFQKKYVKVVVLNPRKIEKQKSQRNDFNATDKNYKCDDCSYAARRKQELLFHIKSRHTMEKPYKCYECSYATVKKSHLLSHIQSHHTMEKSYKCNECSYATMQKRNLLDHIRSHHTMEKPYKCKNCSYAAARERALLYHIQSRHTMEKPYKCNECSFASVRKCDLLSHIQARHTMEKPCKCNECSYAAVRKRDLLAHIQSHHTM